MVEVPGVRKRVHWDRPDIIASWWQAFHDGARKLGRHWEGCHNCPPELRDPEAETDVHHVVPQQRLKQLAARRDWSRLGTLRLLTDKRNSMIVCKRCHAGHTGRITPLYRESIRPYTWEFIDELDLRDEVLAAYPPRPPASTSRRGEIDEQHRRDRRGLEPRRSGGPETDRPGDRRLPT